MKKIGTTEIGSLIVEMTQQEFEALQQLQSGSKPPATPDSHHGNPVTEMKPSELANYVSERLTKLSPKKRSGVVRSIEAMFQFSGGIDSEKIESVISTLQRQQFMTIDPAGRVTYTKG